MRRLGTTVRSGQAAAWPIVHSLVQRFVQRVAERLRKDRAQTVSLKPFGSGRVHRWCALGPNSRYFSQYPPRSLTFLPGFLIPLPGLSGAHRASGARPIVLTREQLDIVSRGLVPAELQRNRRVQIGCAAAAVYCRQPAWLVVDCDCRR